jgi:DNA-binding XRE family transcriptional regulator
MTPSAAFGVPKCPKICSKREKAATLVAEDQLTDEEIGTTVGVSRKTVQRWKHEPGFAQRVQEIVTIYATRAVEHGIARRERRLRVLNEMHDRILRVIDTRAKSPELQHIPGGRTGLVTRMLKGIGTGENYQVVEVYEVDTASLRELRALQRQAAEELGQRVHRTSALVGDLAQRLQSKSEEDLNYYVSHGHWPEEECRCAVN